MGARRPQTPAWSLRSCAARAVGRRARVAGACVAFHGRRAAPCLSFTPPAHPAPSPCSPPAAPRLPCAARGARAPSAPRGAQAAGDKPQPGQAECKCSGQAGSSCQGSPRSARRWRGLDSARLAAGKWPPPGRKSGLGQAAGAARWRSRWSRRYARGWRGPQAPAALCRSRHPATAASGRTALCALSRGSSGWHRRLVLIPCANEVIHTHTQSPCQALGQIGGHGVLYPRF
jgi:hypothetical protein